MAGVVLEPTDVSAAPGSASVCSVRVRNTSAVVESYSLTVLGEAAGWSTVTPASLSLFPGGDGVATISFSPPRHAGLPAGPVAFGVRVVPTQTPDDAVVEEGVVTVEPFYELAARLTPRTSEAKRRARHTVAVDNKGNASLEVAVTASDPDEQLAFDISPDRASVAAGESAHVSIRIAAHHGFARGAARHLPFQVVVSADVEPALPPVTLDGAMSQQPGMPRFLPAVAAAAVIIVLAAILVPGLLKDRDGGGTFSLTGASSGSPASPASGDGAGEGAEAEAEAEAGEDEQAAGDGGVDPAADSAEEAPSGGGSTSGADATGSAGAAATGTSGTSGASTSPAGASAGADGSDGPDEATADAAPVQTTSTTTTTTAPPSGGTASSAHTRFVGSWAASSGCVIISASSVMEVTTVDSGGNKNFGTGSIDDASDNDSFVASFRSTRTSATITLIDTNAISLTTSGTTFGSRTTTTNYRRVRSC